MWKATNYGAQTKEMEAAGLSKGLMYGNGGGQAASTAGGKPINSGHIHYQCEEPGYIMGLIAITPLIDYSQGNDFDLNLQTIDDLHKPALDGIGYQDLIQEQMVGETSVYANGSEISNLNHLAANKTLAWIDYMTNYNRTFGDFAAGEALDFMVLTYRDWETDRKSTRLNSSHITRSRMPSSA